MSPAPLRRLSFAPWMLRCAPHPDASESLPRSGSLFALGARPPDPHAKGLRPLDPRRVISSLVERNRRLAGLMGVGLFGAVSGVRAGASGALPTHPPYSQRCAAVLAAFRFVPVEPCP